MCEVTIYRECTKTTGENVSGRTAMRSSTTHTRKKKSGNDQFSRVERTCGHVISSTPSQRKLRFNRHFVQRIRFSLHCRRPQTNYCFEHFCSGARHATISTQHRIFFFNGWVISHSSFEFSFITFICRFSKTVTVYVKSVVIWGFWVGCAVVLNFEGRTLRRFSRKLSKTPLLFWFIFVLSYEICHSTR